MRYDAKGIPRADKKSDYKRLDKRLSLLNMIEMELSSKKSEIIAKKY
jgi:hypothetical protein